MIRRRIKDTWASRKLIYQIRMEQRYPDLIQEALTANKIREMFNEACNGIFDLPPILYVLVPDKYKSPGGGVIKDYGFADTTVYLIRPPRYRFTKQLKVKHVRLAPPLPDNLDEKRTAWKADPEYMPDRHKSKPVTVSRTMVDYNGESKPLRVWARELGVPPSTLRRHILGGGTVADYAGTAKE